MEPGQWFVPLARYIKVQNASAPMGRCGCRIVACTRDGPTVIEMAVDETVYPLQQGGVAGSVHGGAIAMLVDMTAVTAAVVRMQRAQTPKGTADLSVSYLRPAKSATLRATATCKKFGRALALLTVEVHDDQRRLVASGRVLYALATAAAGAGQSHL